MQIPIYADKTALAKYPVSGQRCKHFDIKYHFRKETVNEGKVVLEYCLSGNTVADVMTKPTTKLKLKRFTQYMFGIKKCKEMCLDYWGNEEILSSLCFTGNPVSKAEWGC